MRKIFIGNDHAGPEYAKTLITYLKEKNYEVEHVGSFGPESVDYPDFGEACARKVATQNAKKENSAFGIVICGTGLGIGISANKVKNIRCAHCVNSHYAEMARAHNDANMIALGARVIDIEDAKNIIDTFLTTQFEGGRHQRRVEKLNAINCN